MAKKILSLSFLTIALIILGLIFFGNKEIISGSLAHYETAETVTDIVCRVSVNNAVKDIKITPTPGGNVLFIPSGTDSVEFVNISDAEGIYLEDGETAILPVACNTQYEVDELNEIFDSFNRSEGRNIIKIMASENVASVFVESEDSLDVIDSERHGKHNASSTVISNEGLVLFSGKLEYIMPRGVSSFLADKKSYEVKVPKSTELIAGISEKEWLLISNYADSTLIRNKIIYEFADNHTVVKAPHAEYVDLYINGYYRGNYLLCEKVRNGTDLLDVSEPDAGDLTGGYLLKLVSEERVGDRPFIQTGLGYYVEVVSPKNVTEDELAYLSTFFDDLENAVVNSDGTDEIEKYLDIDSWADKYLIENAFQNADSAYDSSYFYKKKETDGGKLYAGPAWDYDLTATNRYDIWNTERVGDFYLCSEMLANEAVNSIVAKRFCDVFVPYVKYELAADVHKVVSSNSKSFAMNDVLWDNEKPHDEDDFIERTKTRLDVINLKALGNTSDHIVTFIDFEGNIIKTEIVPDGGKITDIPVCASWWAYFNGWYDESNNERLREDVPIFEDKTYRGNWIYASLIIKNALSELGIDFNNIDEESIETLAKYFENELKQSGEQGYEY